MSRKEYTKLHETIDFTIIRYEKNVETPDDCVAKYNYGASKGLTFDNVAIIPVGTAIPFLGNQVEIRSRQTKAKFYVACTRAKYMIIFLMDSFAENELFKKHVLSINDIDINCYKCEG